MAVSLSFVRVVLYLAASFVPLGGEKFDVKRHIGGLALVSHCQFKDYRLVGFRPAVVKIEFDACHNLKGRKTSAKMCNDMCNDVQQSLFLCKIFLFLSHIFGKYKRKNPDFKIYLS